MSGCKFFIKFSLMRSQVRNASRQNHIRDEGKILKGGSTKVIRRIVNLALITVVLGIFAVEASAQSQLKQCNVQSKPLLLQKTQKPLRLSGVIPAQTSREYLITVRSNLAVDIQLTSAGPLKFDVYSLDPPKVMDRRVVKWSGSFEAGKQYSLAVSNCAGKTPATFQMELAPR